MNRSRRLCSHTISNFRKVFNLKHLAILILALVGLPFLAAARRERLLAR